MIHKRIGVIGGSQGIGKWLVQYFKQEGYIVSYTDDKGQGDYITNIQMVTDADIVILAVPISAMDSVLDEIYPYLEEKLLIDVCSVKSGVVRKYVALKETYPMIALSYISIHPMFGPGVPNIQGQVVLFNYQDGVGHGTITWLKSLFIQNGACIYEIDYQEHDKLMGIIQGLNHFNVFVSAKTLASMGGDITIIEKLSSPSYRIFIIFFARYVMQNPRLYAEIQIYNPYVREVVEQFMKDAQKLLEAISSKDINAFEQYVYDIRPFFAGQYEDTQISNALIGYLGELQANRSMMKV